MSKLLSINYNFFKVEPQKLIEIINKNNNKNIELSIENHNDMNNLKKLKKEDIIEILEQNKYWKEKYKCCFGICTWLYRWS